MPISKLDDNIRTAFLVAGTVIRRDGKFLLVQEKKPKVYGLWNLPAGKAEKGLTLVENAIKETKEETGFDVKIIREIGIYHQENDYSVKHAYEGEIIGGALAFPENEILDAKWLTYEEIIKLDVKHKLRDGWVLEAINEVMRK